MSCQEKIWQELPRHVQVKPYTFLEWSSKHHEFTESIKKILIKQKKQLMDDGMYGGKEVNSAMAIFLLKANHGLKDGAQVQFNQQLNVGEGNSITFINFSHESESQPKV